MRVELKDENDCQFTIHNVDYGDCVSDSFIKMRHSNLSSEEWIDRCRALMTGNLDDFKAKYGGEATQTAVYTRKRVYRTIKI